MKRLPGFSTFRRLLMLPAFVAGFALTTVSEGTVIFQFGNTTDYVEEPQTFHRAASPVGDGPYVSTNPFSREEPLLSGAGYSGPKIYGGYTFSSSSFDVGFSQSGTSQGQGVANNVATAGGLNAIYFNAIGPNHSDFHNTTMSFASVLIFQQSDFNAGFDIGSVGVDSFSLTMYKTGSGSASLRFSPTGRWLVEVGGVFYLSEASFIHDGTDLRSFSISGTDLLNTRWALYDPEAGLFNTAQPGDYAELGLSNITSVGFYLEDASFRANSNTIALRMAISEFTVTGIPEPSTLVLGSAGLVALVLARRARGQRAA